MAVPRQFHDSSTTVPRQFHGSYKADTWRATRREEGRGARRPTRHRRSRAAVVGRRSFRKERAVSRVRLPKGAWTSTRRYTGGALRSSKRHRGRVAFFEAREARARSAQRRRVARTPLALLPLLSRSFGRSFGRCCDAPLTRRARAVHREGTGGEEGGGRTPFAIRGRLGWRGARRARANVWRVLPAKPSLV